MGKELSKILQTAEKCIIQKKFLQASKVLIPHVTKYKSHYYFMYLLGVISFNLDNYDDAYAYFSRAREISSTQSDPLLYLSVIALVSNNLPRSLEYWLRILESEPENKYALRGLKHVENIGDDLEKIVTISGNPYKSGIVPLLVFAGQRLTKALTITGMSIVISGLLFGAIWTGMRGYKTYVQTQKNNERKNIISQLNDSSFAKNLPDEKDFNIHYISLSPNAIRDTLINLEKQFIAHDDNRAWVSVNTILYSNALVSQKKRAFLISKYLQDKNFASETNVTWFDYSEVSQIPWKYNNVTIKWKGTVVFMEKDDKKDFQFLVGFTGNSSELKGIVPLFIPSILDLKDGDEVELVAKVIFSIPPLQKRKKDNIIIDEKKFSLFVKLFRYLL